MIVLDTNVISEPLRADADPAVLAWLNAQAADTLYTTTINLAELYAGVAVLPAGKRRAELNTAIRSTLTRLFGARVLPFDTAAAECYAIIAQQAKASGMMVPHDDALIAAIAGAHGYAIATRNVRNFAGSTLDIINPWDRPTA
ncbi:MAG: type II toxin-antitoxin system VapC family toxin [Solimonas sp.]